MINLSLVAGLPQSWKDAVITMIPKKRTNKLLSNVQSGFRNQRGAGDNLLMVTQKVQEWLNRVKKACGVFFDIYQAFDKVWHAGLIYKLVHLNVPLYLIQFIKSFLSGRTFRVKEGDTYSEITLRIFGLELLKDQILLKYFLINLGI